MIRFAPLAAATALSLTAAVTAQAAPITFTVSGTGPWEDPFAFPAVSDAGGVLAGSFDAEDTNMNGLVDSGEISAWSFTTSGFTDPLYNFTLADSDAGALVTVNNSGTTNEIDPGLSAGLIDFSNFDVVLQLDLQIPFPNFSANFFVFADPAFAAPRTENFTINGQTFPGPLPSPEPGSLMLLLAGGSFVALRARRRGRKTA